MKIVSQILIAVAMVGTFVVPPATAQQQTVRLRGIIEKRDGNILMVKSRDGAELKLNLADKLLIVEVVKASIADIKEGSFIGSGQCRSLTAAKKPLRFISLRNQCGALAKVLGRGMERRIAP
jgi:hypothetical protein